MDDDIYDKLMKQGFLKREVDHKKNKLAKHEKLKKQKILNKVLYRNYSLEDNEKFVPDVITQKDEKNIIIDNIHFTKSFLFVSISNLLVTIIFSGRPGGTRTPNLRFWRPMLYQLSHWPIFKKPKKRVENQPA